jgi:hypothetical protein
LADIKKRILQAPPTVNKIFWNQYQIGALIKKTNATMNHIFFTGLIGSILLVLGAAWPSIKQVNHPTRSLKNWLLAIGGLVMFLYSILNWQEGGPIFFVILETLVVIASILMMLNTDDEHDTKILGTSGIALIIWSLYLFEGYNTLYFILGLTGIGLGYAFKMGTVRRSFALTAGSVLIALFSYIESSWIFFWLNTFFALFSAYYLWQRLASLQNSKKQEI